MGNKTHVEIFIQGAKVWNRWREDHPDIEPDFSYELLRNLKLSGINLFKANLNHANFAGSDISNANLSQSHAYGALIHRSYLNDANLYGIDLSGAELTGAEIKGADLRKSFLAETNFNSADLSHSDFTNAIVLGTVFGNNDLSTVKGLNKVLHRGPSVIGIETIFRSQGKIPESFLKGAGVPDHFITHLPSFAEQPKQFYSCFISHSSKDQRFCDRLYADLNSNGVRIWYFQEDARWGRSVWREIDHSIKIYDKLVVVCSKSSLRSSPVLREIERALEREDTEGKEVLFPIKIDNYVFSDWQHERKNDVLKKVVGDFYGWNRGTAKYENSLKRLLAALQAEGSM